MDDREQHRLHLAGEVMQLVRHRSFREALPPLRIDGSTPFIVGLPDDTLGDIAGRAVALGGRAHLIVVERLAEEGGTRLRVLRIDPGDKAITELDQQRECIVNEGTTIEMLMQHIEVGEALVYHTFDSETVIRFLTDSVQPVPA
jgi:hypothetical protein